MHTSADALPVLRAENAGLDIDENRILRSINLCFFSGEFFVIMGPNGCGKTSLLKLLSGLMAPTQGAVTWRMTSGKYDDMQCALEHGQARVSFVFASGGLISNLTVFDNIALPLRYAGAMAESQCRDAVQRALGDLGLADSAALRPAALSPGLAKRAQIARAIVTTPDVIFYDNPEAGMDARQLQSLRDSMLHMHRRAKRVSVVATASPRWEWNVADRFAFLHDGSVKAVGTRQELLENPMQELRDFLKDVAHAD